MFVSNLWRHYFLLGRGTVWYSDQKYSVAFVETSRFSWCYAQRQLGTKEFRVRFTEKMNLCPVSCTLLNHETTLILPKTGNQKWPHHQKIKTWSFSDTEWVQSAKQGCVLVSVNHFRGTETRPDTGGGLLETAPRLLMMVIVLQNTACSHFLTLRASHPASYWQTLCTVRKQLPALFCTLSLFVCLERHQIPAAQSKIGQIYTTVYMSCNQDLI